MDVISLHGGAANALRAAVLLALAGANHVAAARDADAAATARGPVPFDEIIVTAPRMREPLLVVTDPKQPHQPLPAHDGAEYLKSIPGFSVIRKGGTDGDPVFRGMAASRVNVAIDGQQVLGGCGNRMDPPTAYVFPTAYDRIVVVKGPQTVLAGPGNSAAAVSFERVAPRFESAGLTGNAALTGASFGRTDLVGELRAGTPAVYGVFTGTRAESDDYVDGDGRDVHSRYLRQSANAALGWTPGTRTRLELSGALSDGEAAYADRAMDGVAFDRENLALRLEHQFADGAVERLEAHGYWNYVDHVMDNYSLRTFTPSASMRFRAVSNPDRETTGGKILAELNLPRDAAATVGVDLQRNVHTVRSSMNQAADPYQGHARVEDASFRQAGLFAEATLPVRAAGRVVAGARMDDWQARDEREEVSLGMMSRVPNPTANAERSETLLSGFARYEHGFAGDATTAYAGVGHVERFPDYWELLGAGKESIASVSAFAATEPERTTQLDVGLIRTSGRFEWSLSAFYGEIEDFILIESGYRKGMRVATVTRNVDASTVGAEADLAVALAPTLKLSGTLAYTRGSNETDDQPLAQIPPLEARLGLDWARGAWSAGALLRLVDEQDRYALRQGNIVGQDLGPTSGFAVLSLNGGWRPRSGVELTVGIDNLLDRTYAEHLSRSGAMVPGYEQTVRVNEPGRTAWVKLATQFGKKPGG